MSFLSQFFRPKPEPPFVEYPDGRLKSAREALQEGLRVYRRKAGNRRACISWQGQGSRVDSYHIVDLGLAGDVVSFREAPITLADACAKEGFSFEQLRGATDTDLDISSLSEEEASRLLEALLVKHVHVRPFEDSRDYSVGFEYEKKTE
jgi:hypothetical protein